MDDLATRGRPAGPGRGVRIAVDAMGGDHGPSEVVPGSLAYARANPHDTVILVGDPDVARRRSSATRAAQRPDRPRRAS